MIRRYTDRFLNNRSGRADTRHAISTAVLLAIVTLTAPPCLADVNFTEDFSTSTLKDAANTTAHWSTAQQQVYLDWRDAQADAFTGTTPGADVLTGDSTASQRLAIGDVN
ncbi:hypothetical protein, partial [Sedimenticola sp.]|uniref:hypothetical protein n=1 Tax=Sedimenticola sp. TaxID=1940285 RepID=UPI003D110ACC